MGKMSLENVEDYFSQEDLEDEPSVEDMKKELTNCIYLQDSSVTICGLKIYGTPWQPEFCGWAFNLPRGQVSQFEISRLFWAGNSPITICIYEWH